MWRWKSYDSHGGHGEDSVLVSRKYDVFGAVRASTGSGVSDHKFVGSLGHVSEAETGLIYMRARYMDPALGRFISEDPARDGVNWFVYCDNDPVNLVDSEGRTPFGYAVTAMDVGIIACQFVAIAAFAAFAKSGVGIWELENAYGKLMDFMSGSNDVAGPLTLMSALDIGLDLAMANFPSAVAGYAALATVTSARFAAYVAAYGVRLEYYVDML